MTFEFLILILTRFDLAFVGRVGRILTLTVAIVTTGPGTAATAVPFFDSVSRGQKLSAGKITYHKHVSQ
jgi:hypothetical protein